MARDILFTPASNDINELQNKDKQFQIKLIDDAYFIGLNLDFNVKLAKETTKVAMSTRGKHNCIIFNFQRPTRATKTLLERFKIMFFKPTCPDALLLCRSTLSVLSDDVWGLEPILKAKTDKARIRRIKRNQYYVEDITFRKLKPEMEAKYLALQSAALEERRKGKIIEDDVQNEFTKLAEEMHNKIEAGDMAYMDIERVLKDPLGYNFNDGQFKLFSNFYKRFDMAQKIKRIRKDNQQSIVSVANLTQDI
jgi:hypothetical protein